MMDRPAIPKKRDQDPLFLILKWFLVVTITLTAIVLVTKPLRKIWSNHYVEKGDDYLVQKDFLQADLEYKKAIVLYRANKKAVGKRELCLDSARDILKLENFYREKNITLELENFNLAKSIPKSETDAVRNSKYLIEHEEYQLAIVAAKTAVEMDKGYRDAWLYLGIANLEAGTLVQMDDDAQKYYLDQATLALSQAKNIDPEYQPTLDYLTKIPK